MPVTTQHEQYTEYLPQWQDCRDAATGSRAIKARGVRYLPQLSAQDEKEYEAYKTRALWYGATGRTIQGLVGSVFRKPLQLSHPELMTEHIQDITLTGVSLEAFAKQILAEVLQTGRVGILVDMGKETGDSAPSGDRPYWVQYDAEHIVNWHTEQRAGDTVLTLVVLREDTSEVDPDDPFVYSCVTQYRVLRLGENEGARYTQEIWRETPGAPGTWSLYETIEPTFRGQPLDYIPFCFVGPSSVTPRPEKPPLQDLVDVNLSHYRTSADLEHGCHFTALPTPWVAGFAADTVLKIGSAIAWVTPDPNAKAGMLEFTGDGLGTLERALDRKERLMAVLGARMLEAQKKAVESADTHTIRNAGEASSLQSIAGTLEEGLLKCLRWHARWMGQESAELKVELNKVFVEARMEPTELAELMKAWQGGAISYETLYWNLQRGELTRPDVPTDVERQLIDSQEPAVLPLEDSNPEEPLS